MSHIKTTDGYDVEVPSQGQVTYNTVAGSIGLASAVLGGGFLGGLFGNGRSASASTSSDDQLVSRYELAQEKALAAKDSEIALLKSNIYQDQKSLELYKYIDTQLNAINERLAAQDVRNQGVTDAFREVQNDIESKVSLEAERRQCADKTLVNYMNATFYPKSVADVTVGSTTTQQSTYNPLVSCNC